MKKQYEKPAMQVFMMSQTQMLCGSKPVDNIQSPTEGLIFDPEIPDTEGDN